MMRYVHMLSLGLATCLAIGCQMDGGPERDGDGKQTATINLFNGRDLSGWSFVPADPNADAEETCSVVDGAIVCTGNPIGILRTDGEYENYVLTLEWRWAPGSDGGNSGVLVHCSTPMAAAPWPKSMEVQLKKGNAGDFYTMATDFEIVGAAERRDGRRGINLTDDSEKPIGEWNHMHITCKGDEIKVKVNGVFVNHLTKCSVHKGYIAMQSEGAEIHFRNIHLTPLAE
jgi:hypothetical protein